MNRIDLRSNLKYGGQDLCGFGNKIDSILPLRVHFIYRNASQNKKTEDGEIITLESI